MTSRWHGVILMLREMLSSKLCSLFRQKLHMICMRATTTVTSQTSSCMLEEFSSQMNLMSFFQSISAFWRYWIATSRMACNSVNWCSGLNLLTRYCLFRVLSTQTHCLWTYQEKCFNNIAVWRPSRRNWSAKLLTWLGSLLKKTRMSTATKIRQVTGFAVNVK